MRLYVWIVLNEPVKSFDKSSPGGECVHRVHPGVWRFLPDTDAHETPQSRGDRDTANGFRPCTRDPTLIYIRAGIEFVEERNYRLFVIVNIFIGKYIYFFR